MRIIYSESHNATGPGQNSSAIQSSHYLGNKETEAVTTTPQSVCGILWEEHFCLSLHKWAKKCILQINGKRGSVLQQFSVTQKLEMTQAQARPRQKQLVTQSLIQQLVKNTQAFRTMWSTKSVFLWSRRKHKMLCCSENIQDATRADDWVLSQHPGPWRYYMMGISFFSLEIRWLGCRIETTAQPAN